LYMQIDQGAFIDFFEGDRSIAFNRGGMLSSNSFYESFYAKYINLDVVYYLFKLEGDFNYAYVVFVVLCNKN
jgi:galactofuranosylgalactofuranosylrhamnosyl-N-acetylglucosaminyl-diphospho-decaprenol beta-1,5/1,6-galactofuranosyltransferase